MAPFDAEAPAGAAAAGGPDPDDEVVEGELVDDERDPGDAEDVLAAAGRAAAAAAEAAKTTGGGKGKAAAGTNDAGDTAPSPDAAAAAGIPELSEVERLAAERDEYLDALRRLQADFDNFRKRVNRQADERSMRALESLVERLLPVLDATDLATEHAGDEKDATAFTQIGSLLWDALAKEGLERVSEPGVPFEPAVHDAVAHVPGPVETDTADTTGGEAADGEAPAGLVVDAVLRPGFLLRGKVLRPAMVRVRG